jgi:hypothetical protein
MGPGGHACQLSLYAIWEKKYKVNKSNIVFDLDQGATMRICFMEHIVGIWLWALVYGPIQILKFSWAIHS